MGLRQQRMMAQTTVNSKIGRAFVYGALQADSIKSEMDVSKPCTNGVIKLTKHVVVRRPNRLLVSFPCRQNESTYSCLAFDMTVENVPE
jgi:hypothetical protein